MNNIIPARGGSQPKADQPLAGAKHFGGKNIFVIGGANMDIVSQIDHFPKPGQGIMGPDFKFVPGGKGLNQAVAASRLGGKVNFVGKVGNDSFGQTLRAFLKKEKMDISGLAMSKSKNTGCVMIVVDKNGNNTMVGMNGSNFDISVGDIKNLPIKKGDIVLADFEVRPPVVEFLLKRARSLGPISLLNASPFDSVKQTLLKLTDYLVVNEHELAFFGKTQNFNRAIKKLATKGQTLIATLGKQGLVCFKDGKLIKIAGHKVKAKDTTAAGDCFLGAFAVALSENQDIKSALTFANAAAAISVQTVGASSSLPNRRTVDQFLK